jgi:hypothetical protein
MISPFAVSLFATIRNPVSESKLLYDIATIRRFDSAAPYMSINAKDSLKKYYSYALNSGTSTLVGALLHWRKFKP